MAMQIEGSTLSELVKKAQNGDAPALEALIRSLQDQVLGVALRMLSHPEDAKDAAQEILIKVVTQLSSFRGESALTTWVYRIAANHLLSVKRSRAEELGFTWERFGADIDAGLEVAASGEQHMPEDERLLQEIRVGCTLGMLLCLDRPHRLSYILGEILECDHHEAASILSISPAAYRKRLSRARAELLGFMRQKCGLFNPSNPCRCNRRVGYAIRAGRVNPDQPRFGNSRMETAQFPKVLAVIRQLEEARRAAALYRAQPEPHAPEGFADAVRRWLPKP